MFPKGRPGDEFGNGVSLERELLNRAGRGARTKSKVDRGSWGERRAAVGKSNSARGNTNFSLDSRRKQHRETDEQGNGTRKPLRETHEQEWRNIRTPENSRKQRKKSCVPSAKSRKQAGETSITQGKSARARAVFWDERFRGRDDGAGFR